MAVESKTSRIKDKLAKIIFNVSEPIVWRYLDVSLAILFKHTVEISSVYGIISNTRSFLVELLFQYKPQ